ncbi:short-chain dehydrogenase [Flavobacterium sp. 316]|uniref:SDR family NAD(P)-dependent oxidoreductase n=1 Tax=Flavobacterium sediminilitoris TaxID=2024526 RepID=A0ABY4HJA6_9FLAO|nr:MULTISPECIES: SDR family NAD(P)-dependent oxidoreductase [Flavobacterium]KIX20125.1 short-chain dehydrogenase [Flavobacterium sp. 316]UOX32736.1 SDR family NAD(P)-dependent oxidoreductase [Flavobacterium sediminilitoris]
MNTILITGASGGLGRLTSKYFADKGWNVIATMVNLDLAGDLVNYKKIKCYKLDVTSSECIEEAKQNILRDYKVIDVIINNAGLGYRSFVELSEDSKIDTIVNVNWLGVVKVCRAFIPIFRKQNHGQFINITSIAGLVNLPLGNFYHSTKQAVESFSECMSYELLDFNVSVCTVQFGNAPTNFQKNVTKCRQSDIPSYNNMMETIDQILNKKNNKNKDLTNSIISKLYSISENPSKRYKKYTIGFDANLMRYLRKFLGYRLFNFVIKQAVLKS